VEKVGKVDECDIRIESDRLKTDLRRSPARKIQSQAFQRKSPEKRSNVDVGRETEAKKVKKAEVDKVGKVNIYDIRIESDRLKTDLRRSPDKEIQSQAFQRKSPEKRSNVDVGSRLREIEAKKAKKAEVEIPRNVDEDSESDRSNTDLEELDVSPEKPEPGPDYPPPPSADASISTLKEYFAQLKVEFRHRAFERSDLLNLLKEVTDHLAKSLNELRNLSQLPQASAVECMRFLVNPTATTDRRLSTDRRKSCGTPSPTSAPQAACNPPSASSSCPPTNGLAEAKRICKVNTMSHGWYYTVLKLKRNPSHDEVLKQFRYYLRLLHPDKIYNADAPPVVSQALEKVKEAKKAAEEALNNMNIKRLPPMIHGFMWNLISAVPRQRVIRLTWEKPSGPIDKYTIQVLDPSFGRFLNICVLEPDYYEDKQKFVPIEELNEYLIDEKKLDKMSHLFDYSTPIEFQVAAHNSDGMGPYVRLKVDLSGKTYGSWLGSR